jgi:hypothetical protein
MMHEGSLSPARYRRGAMEPPPEAMLTLRSRHNGKTDMAEIEVPAMGPLFSISPVMTGGYDPPLLVPRPSFSVRDLLHVIRIRPTLKRSGAGHACMTFLHK